MIGVPWFTMLFYTVTVGQSVLDLMVDSHMIICALRRVGMTAYISEVKGAVHGKEKNQAQVGAV